MSKDPTYKMIEIVGTSSRSYSEAVANGIEKSAETLENIDWFEVDRFSGRVEKGKVVQYQATMKVGFRLR